MAELARVIPAGSAIARSTPGIATPSVCAAPWARSGGWPPSDTKRGARVNVRSGSPDRSMHSSFGHRVEPRSGRLPGPRLLSNQRTRVLRSRSIATTRSAAETGCPPRFAHARPGAAAGPLERRAHCRVGAASPSRPLRPRERDLQGGHHAHGRRARAGNARRWCHRAPAGRAAGEPSAPIGVSSTATRRLGGPLDRLLHVDSARGDPA